jgi:hypothetical protein
MKFNVLFLSLLLVTVSCKQVPYPEGGDLVVEGRDEIIPIPQPHAIVVDQVIDFTEGRLRNYQIGASVDEPGEPILIAENLPEGATFDEETFELRWRPGYFTANDINNPTEKVKDYPVVFELSSTIEPERNKRRFEIILRVSDNPRGITIERDNNKTVKEGSVLKSLITITDKDFPDGPFIVTIDDVPEAVRIEKESDNVYAIVYEPNHFVVSLEKDGESFKKFDSILTVTNPRGGRSVLNARNADITVQDKRLYPIIAPPKLITQSLDVSLQVVSYDTNKEIAPVMTLTSERPSFGDFETEVIESPTNSSSVLNVRWTNIPPIHNGTTHTLNFKTCVLSKVGVVRLCQEGSTEVKIVLRDRKPPVIDRRKWPVGELIYLGFNQEENRRVSITDQEDRNLTPKVEIFPEEMREFVRWTNGNIRLKFDKAGTFQFNLIATSDYNVSSAQSFIVEVFPKTRKKVLFFADSTRDPESIFYKSQFDAQMMNPAIQEVSKRNISNRETLIITTSTLLDLENRATILTAIKAIPNVVISSPLIGNLPEPFIKTLNNIYKVKSIGRYSELSNGKPLDEMFFSTTSQFEIPQSKIGLKGKASRESRNPAIFNGDLDEKGEICKEVLGISHDGLIPLIVGVVCERQKEDRRGGGRITLLGTEWADLKTTREDLDIPSQWFQSMIKKEF